MEAQSATIDRQASGPEGHHGGPYKHAEASQPEQNKLKDLTPALCMVRACVFVCLSFSAYM